MEGVIRYAEAQVPTLYGPVRLLVYREFRNGVSQDVPEHVAVCFGDFSDVHHEVMVRVHSECLTSEVFGSLKCDCREQLQAAMFRLSECGQGVLLYLRQEGRGIGLGNKIKAYALQEAGADTVDANHQLGFDTDLRNYDVAGFILQDLGIQKVELLTNNPDKVSGLSRAGIDVTARLPLEIEANVHSASYLATKKQRLGHLFQSLKQPL